MKAIKRLLKSRRGVTLSELLVTIAILAILLPSVTVTLISALNVFSRTKDIADINILSANLENAITNQLTYGYNTTISTDAESGNYIQFEKYGAESVRFDTRPAGADAISILYMNGSPLYGVSYYDGISTAASFEEEDGVVTVVLDFSGRITYRTSFTVRPRS